MSKNKLSQYDRKQIENSVIDATTFTAEAEVVEKEIANLVRQCVISSLPPLFAEATKNLPQEWLVHRVQYYLGFISYTAQFAAVATPVTHNVEIPDSVRSVIITLNAKRLSILQAKLNMRKDVGAFLAGCTTPKQVVELMPTFARHVGSDLLPKPERPIVVSAKVLTQKLTMAGFDKEVKK